MSNPSQFVLYDIPSRDPRHCWSWNVWKTRFLLNFKGLDYVTEWTEYPDIKPKLEKHLPDETEFTVPTVRLPGGEYIMESRKIADRIEADYPNPPVHLDSPYVERLIPHLRAALVPIQAIYIRLVFTEVIRDESILYFDTKRKREMGMTIEQFYEKYRENAWEKSETGFHAITAMLQENEGPFFMGQTVSYADFIYAGALLFLRQLGDDVFSKLLKASGDDGKTILALLEAVEPWSKRDSY
ncbi:hypothetical protein BGZ63DRAFT_256486 [Mariannaea sp. PMI_226]|nr:hypothetical protein BGZ63DRAFT_256486 [Mariannaea sp. PMI_226]